MSAQCVAVTTDAGGLQVLTVDNTCAAGLVVVDSGSYAAMAQNPLLIPLDSAGSMAWATMGLFVAVYLAKITRRALD